MQQKRGYHSIFQYLCVSIGISILLWFTTLYSYQKKQWWSFTTQAPITGGRAYSIPRRSPFTFDAHHVYVNDYHGHIYALNRTNGSVDWTYMTNNFSPYPPAVDQDSVYVEDFVGYVYSLDSATGKERWRFLIPDRLQPDTPAVINERHVYIGARNGKLYALDKSAGSLRWQFNVGTPNITSHKPGEDIIHFGIMTANNNLVVINSPYHALFRLNAHNGQLISNQYLDTYEPKVPYIETETESANPTINQRYTIHATDEYDQTTITISDSLHHVSRTIHQMDFDARSLTIHDDVIYGISRDFRRISAIPVALAFQISKFDILRSCCLLATPTPLLNFNSWLQSPQTLPESWLARSQRVIKSLFNNDFVITTPVQISDHPAVYELTITHNEEPYTNPFSDVSIQTTFSHTSGKIITIQGFYYDHDIWKVRFAPPFSGQWTWHTKLHTPTITLQQMGSFAVTPFSVSQGFLKISPNNSMRFVYPDNSPFIGVGLQNSMRDYNFDGDPLNQWESIENSPYNTGTVRYTDMDTYFQTYANHNLGFNLYRFGVDNASFRLWQTISPQGNRYGISAGIWGDRLVRSLNQNGYRIWMTIFGFEPPFPDNIKNHANRHAINHYLDYVVARFGAFVDIWELMNEASVPDEWITYVATRLRAIDPYQHPITTNWERADHSNIDVVSTHWYESDSPQSMDIATKTFIQTKVDARKPIIASEVGNKHASWDPFSALRFRVKLWVSFFYDSTLIFWNQSGGYYKNPNNANVYIGKQELSYVQFFRTFTNASTVNMKPLDIPVNNPRVRSYGKQDATQILGYLYHYQQRTPISTSITFTIKKNGVATWYSPATGAIIHTTMISQGTHTIDSPVFYEDLAIKIEYK